MCKVISVISNSATLWTIARQTPLPTGFSRQECWSGLPYPTPGDLPNPGIEPTSPLSLALAGRFFTTSAVWKAHILCQLSSVVQSCPTLCNPLHCSTPSFPVQHHLRSLLKLMSIKSVIPSKHLILCRPLLLQASIFSSIRVFSNESVLHIRWPKY